MDSGREGGSMKKPPLLDGINYPFCKARMKAFIKSVDEKSLRSIVIGWTPPMEKVGDKKEIKLKKKKTSGLQMKNDLEWDSWNILETAYEGTTPVKISKLQILTTRFEELNMGEDETLNDFNTRLCDISNEAFSLGENT
ncbi:uncharacterized protein [Henckelia pumila]|uniref:uncharacterized protein n=1 Tax=Henckelia pumila TaxID=405737 RepID=UPI003C6E1398